MIKKDSAHESQKKEAPGSKVISEDMGICLLKDEATSGCKCCQVYTAQVTKGLFFFFPNVFDIFFVGSLMETKLVSKSLGQRKGRARAILFLNTKF